MRNSEQSVTAKNDYLHAGKNHHRSNENAHDAFYIKHTHMQLFQLFNKQIAGRYYCIFIIVIVYIVLYCMH